MKRLMERLLRSKRAFSNAIILFCVGYMAVYLQECLLVQGKTVTDIASLAKVAGAFFGGELLLICMAYRFGGKQTKNESFEEDRV